ncbi:Membrane protein OS=Streptomyces viridochromogenes OX=1938 GN=ACM01_45745 PE=4 SV=1 [Streptomyces viridochromogenes]
MRPMSYGQQGGPPSQWDPWKPHSQQPWNGGTDQTPDWAALAEASETRNKRRRLLFIGGGALATVAIGAAVAVAVVSANGNDSASGAPASGLPSTADLPGESAAVPSFAPTSAPPPLDPKDFIAGKDKDTAPLGAQILFPGTQLTMGETVYKKGATDDTKNCSAATKGGLPKILAEGGCTRFMRVSYLKDGIAVTVGVAVFDTEAKAQKAKSKVDTKKDIVRSLSGKGVKDFCTAAVCRSTSNSYGRYAYFTITGFTSGRNMTDKDTAAFKAGDDLAEFTFRQIRRRGEAQASAAAGE